MAVSEARTPGRTRLLWTTCAALLAHAAAYSSIAHLEVGARIARPPPHAEAELDVELDEVTSVTASPAPASAEPAQPRSRPESARGAADARRGSPTEPSPAPAQEEPSGEATWTFSPNAAGSGPSSGPLAGRALDRAVRAGIDATLAQDREADARRSAMIPSFTPHEIGLGLAPGGGLASLGRDIARRSRVPDGSQAELQFDTNAAGVVVAFRVLEATSARFEWEEVAQAIAAASREKPAMRVPEGWRGVAVTLHVSCELRTVDGATSREDRKSVV